MLLEANDSILWTYRHTMRQFKLAIVLPHFATIWSFAFIVTLLNRGTKNAHCVDRYCTHNVIKVGTITKKTALPP